MTDSEFSRIAGYMSERYGLDLQNRRVFIENRMDNYLLSRGYNSYDEYMNAVEYDVLGIEEQKLVEMLTVGHTYFLREPEHFDFLKNVILPEIKEKESSTRNLKIWCAGASSGEEPYTIAMIIKDFLGDDYDSWDTGLMATDLSRRELERALKGVYAKQQVELLPKPWIKNHFVKLNSRQYEVRQDIRKNVIFRQFNLKNPFPFKNKLHIIFLRNVMMYLDEETNRDLLKRVCGFLEPGGYLFTGMTESIDREAVNLEYLGTSVYKKPLF